MFNIWVFVNYYLCINKIDNNMKNLINREEAKKVAKELAVKWNQDEETIYSFIIFLNGREATDELMGEWFSLRRYQLEWLGENQDVVKQFL